MYRLTVTMSLVSAIFSTTRNDEDVHSTDATNAFSANGDAQNGFS